MTGPDPVSIALLLGNAAATLYLVGLVWLVQCVHYPLFAGVGREQFLEYERAHVARITPVVAPAMIVEAGTAVGQLLWLPPHASTGAVAAGLALVVVIWLSTFALQVPRHEELRQRFDARAHARLVRTNWIRTAAWSARGVLVLHLLYAAIAGAAG